jgi:anti-anti-sigma factor
MATTLSTALAPLPIPESAASAPRLEVSVREAPGELVVRVAGEAGVAQAGELAVALLRLSARRAPLVTLDLSRLSLLSSLAMGALATFRRGIVRAGGRVRLVACMEEQVRESLERTGMIAQFEAAEDCEVPGAALECPAQQQDRAREATHAFPKVHDLERRHGLTWGELAGMEPRLAELLWQARAAGARCRDWEDVPQTFAPFRNAVAEIVGFQGKHRGHPVLGSVGAYEVAYWRLHEAVAGLLPKPSVEAPCTGQRGT